MSITLEWDQARQVWQGSNDMLAIEVHPPDARTAEWPAYVRARFDAIGATADALQASVAAALWERYEQSWRDDEEDLVDEPDAPTPASSAADLGSRFTLFRFVVWADGAVSLSYRDGGMFIGHTIVADLDEQNRVVRASLVG